MSELAINIVGANVKAIRKALGLSQLKFSIVIGLSKASIINIESGKKGYNLKLLESVTSFTKYSLNDLSNKYFKPDANLRNKLGKLYKHSEFSHILNCSPEIVYAIEFKLLKSDFIDQPKEISQIKSFFERFGWKYSGTSISNALKRMPDLIEIRQHETKKNTNIYLKKSK
ncbi:MAG TPA: helix-turn-helix transcriptional regulator [Daejeonella sp.]|uniref:helix-turn-helix domain-containing protein n=1 Tax=Daejeonella sp. TaxID=2805397 RepID=UPI002ED8D98B